VPMLSKRLPRIIESFSKGGGVSYSEYRPDFTEAMDASWRLLYDGLLIKGFLPAAKGLPERLKGGIRVADIGCGTGHAVNLMAREYPASSFVGYDLGEDAIVRARAEAREMGLTNAVFEVLDVTQMKPEPRFDLITSFDAIHDQRDPATVLRRVAGALAPGGVYLMVEPKASSKLEENIGNPFAPYMYGMSVLHCMTVSLAAGGAGLGTAWGEQTARRMLGEGNRRGWDREIDKPIGLGQQRLDFPRNRNAVLAQSRELARVAADHRRGRGLHRACKDHAVCCGNGMNQRAPHAPAGAGYD